MNTLEISPQTPVGEIVANNYRTSSIFHQHKIDFCCNGGQTLQEACKNEEDKIEEVLRDLTIQISPENKNVTEYKNWSLTRLADHIEDKHHRYVAEQTPTLLAFLKKLCKVHGSRHPELFEIEKQFGQSAQELAMHMKKEELLLFPHIRKMELAKLHNEPVKASPFGSVKNPIAAMMSEHDNEGARFREIAKLTQDYTPPADACRTYITTFKLLADFEKDLHLHIHLENNILFKRTELLEKELS